jgi:hypothetical protein
MRTFQRQNLLAWVHYGTVSSDRSPQNIVGVGEVDNDYLVLFVDLLPHTYEMVGFKCKSLQSREQFSPENREDNSIRSTNRAPSKEKRSKQKRSDFANHIRNTMDIPEKI